MAGCFIHSFIHTKRRKLMARLSDLPADLRRACIQGLDGRSLAAVETVSKSLREAVDDDAWRSALAPFCAAQISRHAATAREAFKSANGWAHIGQVERRELRPAPGMDATYRVFRIDGGRWDADDSLVACWDDGCQTLRTLDTTAQGVQQANTWAEHQIHGFERRNDEICHDIHLLPGGDLQPRALFAVGTANSLPRLCALTRARDESLSVMPLWQLQSMEHYDPCEACTLLWHPSNQDHVSIRRGQFASEGDRMFQLCDLETGQPLQSIDFASSPPATIAHGEPLQSMCGHASNPHLTTLGLCGSDKRSQLVTVDSRVHFHSCACHILQTHHNLLKRVGRGKRDNEVMVTHGRCKDVEVWDIRQTATIGGQPIRKYRCSGNSPEFSLSEDGILACVARGSPRTSYGAKVHIFSDTPCHVAASAVLKEVVSLPTLQPCGMWRSRTGLAFSSRSLTLYADSERLIRYSLD